jgi:hypothetical protein
LWKKSLPVALLPHAVEAQQSSLTDNLMEPPPEAAYLLSGESNAQANLDHTPWSHEQC